MRDVKVETAEGKFGQSIAMGRHRLRGDEPVEAGGDDTGPSPHELLLAALGACTSMTLKLYADRKGWSLQKVEVVLRQEKKEDHRVFHREIRLHGDLDSEQREKLLEIANKCPVHKTLTQEIRIESKIVA